MTEEHGCGPGCGCNATNLYVDKECPVCGKRLRVTGNLQELKINLTCAACGYQTPRLSVDELRVLID